MAQNKNRPDADEMFARMFGQTKAEPAEQPTEEGDTAGGGAAIVKPPAKGSKATEPAATPTASRATAKDAPGIFAGKPLNKKGKAHKSFFLDPKLIVAIDQRCIKEKAQGYPGQKSMVVEAALEQYLAEELKNIEDMF